MTLQGIDLAKLTLQDALDLAILVEEEAMDRYHELADQLELHHTSDAAAFFRFMARNESKHRAHLSARRRKLFGLGPANVTRAMIFDVEAPDYDDARAFMTPRQALEVALRSERKAAAFFDGALPGVREPGVHALFTELRLEEKEHERLVLAEIARLPTEPKGNDWEDPPAGQ